MKKLILLALALTVCGVLILRHTGDANNAQSVHDVLVRAPQLIGREVTVNGVASGNIAVLGVGAFVLRGDDGSTLAVLSSRGVPLSGTRITVRGVLRQAFAAGSVQQLVLLDEPSNAAP
jgi:hypothetical protein